MKLCFAVLLAALLQLPILTFAAPDDAAQQASQHDQDLKSFDSALRQFTPLPDRAAFDRLERWVHDHPNDVPSVILLVDLYQLPQFGLSLTKGWPLILQLKDKDNPDVSRELGRGYALGLGGQEKLEEGLHRLEQGMSRGDSNALLISGRLSTSGQGAAPRDFKLAEACYNEALRLGDKRAYYRLALLYALSPGSTQVQFLKSIRQASEVGDPQAQCEYAKWLTHNAGASSADEAFRWMRKSADWGWAEAQYLYSDMLRTGRGVPQDLHEATRWCLKAAEQHNGLAELLLVDAAFGLKTGYEIAPNHEEGLRWLKRSADDENGNARYLLGTMYLSGTGVKQDAQEARRLLALAADENDNNEAAAMLKLLDAPSATGNPAN